MRKKAYEILSLITQRGACKYSKKHVLTDNPGKIQITKSKKNG